LLNRLKIWLVIILLPIYIIADSKSNSLKLLNTTTKANDILERSYRYIGALKEFSFEATLINEDIYDKSMVVEVKHQIRVKLKRDTKLRIDIDGDTKNRTYYLYGNRLISYDRDIALYAELVVPYGIDKALDYIYENYKIETPLANILYSDIYNRLRPKVKGNYFGMTMIDNKLCDYIGFSNQKTSYQVWIAKGAEPLIMKYVIIDKTDPFRLHSTTYIKWDKEKKISDKFFKFDQKNGIYRVDIVSTKGEI